MIKHTNSILFGLIISISMSVPVYAKGSAPNGQPFLAIQSEFLTLDERVTALEVICQPPFSLSGELEEHEGVSQVVCGSEELYTAPSQNYRQLVQDTVVAPLCLIQGALQSGLQDTLKTYLENALNTAAEESAALASLAVNESQAAIVGALNAVLDAQAAATNIALGSITSEINIQLGKIESGLDAADHQINQVNDNVRSGVNKLKDRVRDFIETLDDPDYMPDFIAEADVRRFFNGISTLPVNLDIPNVNLGTIPTVSIPPLSIQVADISIDVEYIDVNIPNLLEAVLDAINLCNHPEQYTDLILAIYGFEDAIDATSGNIGMPFQVPDRGEAVQMCAVRGGHICTEQELDVIGVTPNTGDWAGGSDDAVVWLPGTPLYSTPWPPIQSVAGALFNFPRSVPFTVTAPVYPTGYFSCCTSTIQ